VLVPIAALSPAVFVIITMMVTVVIAFAVPAVTLGHDATRRQGNQPQ
jgi:hypothetical protein